MGTMYRPRRLPLGVGLIALLLLAPASQVRAGQHEVASTDGPTACPAVNKWGSPTNYNCFSPDSITIQTGDTVVWKWTGQRPHDVTADDGSFQSPTVQPGGTWSHTFSTPGRVAYYCSLHGGPGGQGHAAEIIVQGEAKGGGTASQPGQAAGSSQTGGNVSGRPAVASSAAGRAAPGQPAALAASAPGAPAAVVFDPQAALQVVTSPAVHDPLHGPYAGIGHGATAAASRSSGWGLDLVVAMLAFLAGWAGVGMVSAGRPRTR